MKGKVKDDALVFDDRFKIFKFIGEATQNLVRIDDFAFIGIQNQIAIDGEGKVGMTSKVDSRLVLSIKDPKNTWGKDLKSETGQDALPVLLEGQGFGMKPNIGYTLKRLAKSSAKTQAKKQIEKQTDKFIEKNIKNEKVKELLKDKVDPKKLLKGLFN